jgi:hypothetical protein
VLARLSSIPGVTRARVDVTGHTFVIEPAKSADRTHIVEETLAALGPGSRHLEEPWCWLEGEGLDDGDLWFDARSIRTLSFIEARMLASAWGRTVAAQSELGPEAVDRLVIALRSELVREFERVHAEDGARARDWYATSFAEACRRAVRLVDQESALPQAGIVLETLLAAAGK